VDEILQLSDGMSLDLNLNLGAGSRQRSFSDSKSSDKGTLTHSSSSTNGELGGNYYIYDSVELFFYIPIIFFILFYL
jgi:hypothetical protein